MGEGSWKLAVQFPQVFIFKIGVSGFTFQYVVQLNISLQRSESDIFSQVGKFMPSNGRLAAGPLRFRETIVPLSCFWTNFWWWFGSWRYNWNKKLMLEYLKLWRENFNRHFPEEESENSRLLVGGNAFDFLFAATTTHGYL